MASIDLKREKPIEGERESFDVVREEHTVGEIRMIWWERGEEE